MNAWERRAAAERAVSHLVQLAQDSTIDTLTVREEAGLLRLEAALAQRKMQPHAPSRTSWRFKVATALAAAAMTVGLLIANKRSSNQAFEVANGTVSGSGYIRSTAPDGAEIRFADGTHVVLEPNARTRVAEVYPQGARILLEEGKARLHVTPRPEARWLVEAGPYTLQVTGTVFDVAWLGQEESLDLWLREGSVLVTGPLTTQGFVVRAGQRLVARVRENMLLLDGRPSEDFRSNAETVTDAPATDVPEPPHAHAPKAIRSAEPRSAAAGDEARAPSWSKRLAAGDFEGILVDAERRGIDNILYKASRTELGVLADAARYARRFDVARRALLAERERFAGSVQAHEAAFFLGGLAESDAAPIPSALEWYERYLVESPQGTYASQALGRKLMIVHRMRGREAAKSLALGYLNQFPKGPYARYARNLLETNVVK